MTRSPSETLILPYKARVLSGLIISNNLADATNDIDIAAGFACDDSGYVWPLAAGITRQLDVSFGTGNGGRLGGAIANGTYHVWMLRNTVTGALDIAFDTFADSTATNVPANWVKVCRIASILREAAAIVLFTQIGDTFIRKNSATDHNPISVGTSDVTLTVSVPDGLNIEALIRASTNVSATTSILCVWSPLQNSQTVTGTGADGFNVGGAAGGASSFYGGADLRLFTNTTRNLYAKSSTASRNLYISTLGWVDRRGWGA